MGSNPSPCSGRRPRRALSRLLLLFLTLGAASGPLAEAAEEPDDRPADSPPVLLRETPFLTPVEAAGTGLAPEVKVRLTVDVQGRVREPQVLAIVPSTPFDELFRETTLETLERWRYAPARRDGAAAEATLEWTIQFLPRSARSAAAADPTPIFERETRLARVFALPIEEQAERLRRFASVAEGHLVASRRRLVQSDRFVVVSDAEQDDVARIMAGNLEAVYQLLDQTLRPSIEPRPHHYKLVVYLFARSAAFTAVARELLEAEWPSGLYVPPGLLAFHLEVGSVEGLLGLMVHETVHAYTDRLMRSGTAPPPWLAEGLAEYFGKSEIVRGRLVPGRIREGAYTLDPIRGGAYRRTTHAGWSLGDAKRELRAGRAPALAELVAAAPPTFYGDDVAMHYALSWLFVHYLRHGEAEWAEREFPDLLLYLAEGYPTETALEAVYGRTLDELDAGFRAHVRDL